MKPLTRDDQPSASGIAIGERVRCRTVALDFGGTISTDREDHILGQKRVEQRAAAALHEMARRGVRLLLASNALAPETRWPALQAAGVHELFAVGLISYSLNVAKDDPLFYDLVRAAAQCPAQEVLFVGNSIADDVAGPMRAGMQACLVRPGGLRPDEQMPGGALLIGHVAELPPLLEAM